MNVMDMETGIVFDTEKEGCTGANCVKIAVVGNQRTPSEMPRYESKLKLAEYNRRFD